MPKPLEICLEELEAGSDEERFVRCVALPGGQPGLALDRAGVVRWMPDEGETCGLWISQDDQLMLRRAAGAAAVTVERQGRSLAAPVGKPVVLRDQDVLALGGRRLRVHVHGETEAIHEPERLSPSIFRRVAQAAAAAATLALGGAAAAGAGPAAKASPATSQAPPIQVRSRPPEPVAQRPIDCNITSQLTRGGVLEVYATCPSSKGIRVGLNGWLLDAKTGQNIPKGMVRLKTVTGNKVVGVSASLTKPVNAKKMRIWVDPY